MSMGLTEILMYAVFAIVGLIFYVLYIHPKFFGKPKGPTIDSPAWRPRPVIIDKTIPGGFAEIEGRESFDNGIMVLHLRNKHGPFIREYTDDEVVPLSSEQVLADEGNPIWITKSTKYGRAEYKSEVEESKLRQVDVIKERDYWKREHAALKANISNEVETQIKRATEYSKGSNRPDWNKSD
jgi:hypothetical protein